VEHAKRIERLIKAGFASLTRGDFQTSLRIGKQLKSLRHSSAFEILALAYLRQGKLDRAIAYLEDGVSKAPLARILWELLGNCYSDKGRFVDAERIYLSALKMDKRRRDTIHLNRGIAFGRAGNFGKALNALKLVKSPRLQRRADAFRIRVALSTGKLHHARAIANRLARVSSGARECYDAANEAEVWLTCALALQTDPRTKRKALRFAHKAGMIRPESDEILRTVREICGERAAGMKYHRLILEGTLQCDGSEKAASGFFRTVGVLAKNAEDALRKTKPYFCGSVQKTLSIAEVNVLEGVQVDLGGVYYLSDYMCFPKKKNK
jgi:tetratricopeptide (TPR) repeat protein